MAGKPSKTVQQLINQFNIDTSNIIKNAGKPVVYDRSKVKINPAQSNWIYSYKPTKSTAKNKNTKANLTSIKNNIAHAGKSGLDKLLYALDIIDRPREVVAGVVDKLTDGKDQNWGDYKKGIADSWMGRKETSASDIMENLGWKNKKGWNWNNPLDMAHDLVAFTGDVALDPLTYATFGAGGALKATAKAAAPFIKQAEAQAVRQGLKKGTARFDDYVRQTVDNNPKAQDAIKRSLAKNNNQALGINVPFGPQVKLANKPDFLKKKTQKISTEAASSLARKMDNPTASGGFLAQGQRYDLVSNIIGRKITSFKELNTQEYDFINQLWNDDLLKSVDTHFNPNTMADPLDSFRKVMDDFKKTGKNYTHYDGLDGISDFAKKVFSNKRLAKFQHGAGSILGSRRFVSQGTRIRDHRVAPAMARKMDIDNGNLAKAEQHIGKLRHLSKTPEFKSLSESDWKEVAYYIEGKHPSHAGYKQPSTEKMEIIAKTANALNEYMKTINHLEDVAGVQYTRRTGGYFPHIYNLSREEDFDQVVSQLQNMGNYGQQVISRLKNAKGGFQHERTQFETMADLEDFLVSNAGSPIAEKFKKTVWNPLEAFGITTVSRFKQIADAETLTMLGENGLLHSMKNVPEGWTRLEGIKGLEGMPVPREIGKEIMGLNKLLTNDADLNKFMNQADSAMSIMRRNFTVTKFGFHVRQVIGNIFQNSLAGVTSPAYTQAAKYMKNPEKYPSLHRELMEYGIINTGQASADLTSDLGRDLGRRLSAKSIGSSVNPFGDNFVLGRVGRKAGEMEDNFARSAHYIHMRKNGMSPEQASDSVRKYLYNYSEINNAGRAFRMVIPFYQWMRNNIPFQLVNAVKNPRGFSIAQQLLQSMQQEPDLEKVLDEMGIYSETDRELVRKLVEENGGVLPEYIQDNYVSNRFGYFNIGLPTQDLKNAVDNPGKYLVQSLNPVLTTMYELSNNTRQLNSSPIDYAVPKGESIYTSGEGIRHAAINTIGSPAQLGYAGWDAITKGGEAGLETLAKGTGTNHQEIDPTKEVDRLIRARAELLKARKRAAERESQ